MNSLLRCYTEHRTIRSNYFFLRILRSKKKYRKFFWQIYFDLLEPKNSCMLCYHRFGWISHEALQPKINCTRKKLCRKKIYLLFGRSLKTSEMCVRCGKRAFSIYWPFTRIIRNVPEKTSSYRLSICVCIINREQNTQESFRKLEKYNRQFFELCIWSRPVWSDTQRARVLYFQTNWKCVPAALYCKNDAAKQRLVSNWRWYLERNTAFPSTKTQTQHRTTHTRLCVYSPLLLLLLLLCDQCVYLSFSVSAVCACVSVCVRQCAPRSVLVRNI